MNNKKEVTFQDTIEWANVESGRKLNRTRRFPVFYLMLGLVLAIIIIILLIYMLDRDEDDEDVLDMMRNDDYIYVEESYDGSDLDGSDDHILIEISDEE